MAQSLHITFVRHAISEVIILTSSREGFLLSEDGVVYDDSVDFGVVVGFFEGIFDVDGVVELSKFVAESVSAAGFSGPFCVLFRCGVVIG